MELANDQIFVLIISYSLVYRDESLILLRTVLVIITQLMSILRHYVVNKIVYPKRGIPYLYFVSHPFDLQKKMFGRIMLIRLLLHLANYIVRQCLGL